MPLSVVQDSGSLHGAVGLKVSLRVHEVEGRTLKFTPPQREMGRKLGARLHDKSKLQRHGNLLQDAFLCLLARALEFHEFVIVQCGVKS